MQIKITLRYHHIPFSTAIIQKPEHTALAEVAIAVRKHHDRKQLREEGCLWFMLPAHHCRKSGQDHIQRRNWRLELCRGHAGVLLTACSSWLAQIAFLWNPGPPAPAWHHPLMTN